MNSPVECNKSFVLSTLIQLATWAWAMANCAYFSNNMQVYYMSTIGESFNIASIDEHCESNTTYALHECLSSECYESLNNSLDEFNHSAKAMVEYSNTYATAFRITLTGFSLLIYSCFIISRYFTKELDEPVYNIDGFSMIVTTGLSFFYSITNLYPVDVCTLAKKIPHIFFNHSKKSISSHQIELLIPFTSVNKRSVLNTIIGDNGFGVLQLCNVLLCIVGALLNNPSSSDFGFRRKGYLDGFDRLDRINQMDYYRLVRKARKAFSRKSLCQKTKPRISQTIFKSLGSDIEETKSDSESSSESDFGSGSERDSDQETQFRLNFE